MIGELSLYECRAMSRTGRAPLRIGRHKWISLSYVKLAEIGSLIHIKVRPGLATILFDARLEAR